MTVSEALSAPALHQGALWGLASAGAVAGAAIVATIAGHRPRGWPIAGLAGVVAAALALRQGIGIPAGVVASLGLLGLGGALRLPWRLPAVIPGALVLAAQVPAALPRWAAPLVAVATVAAAAAGPEVDAQHRPGVGPAVMAGAALGTWACVPDVYQAAPVAAAFALVAAGSLIPPLRLGRPFVGPAAALVVWAAGEGARGRPASLVGAAAGLGLFGIVPLANWLRGSARPSAGWGGAVTVVLGQMTFVAFTSRVAGLQTEVRRGVALSAVALVVASVVATILARPNARVGGPDTWR